MSICGLCNWLWIWLGFKLKSHIFFPWGLDICSCTMFLPWRVLPGRLIPEWTFLQQVTRHCLDAYRIFSLSLKSISTGCVSVLSSEHQLFLKWCVLSVCKFKSAFISIKCPIFTIVGQSLSHVWLCDPMDCSMPGFPVLHCLLEFVELMSIEAVMPSNHLILCRPLLLLPLILTSVRVFSNESALHIRWPKYWSFSFSISPFREYSGLISFRIDWFDLLAVQGILESSSMLSLLYGLTLTSVHDYQQDHHFDYTDLCQQSNVSAF